MAGPFDALLRAPLLRGLTQSALLAMEPETAHAATITALKMGLVPPEETPDPPELKTHLAGLDFTNPIGMAAGFDKNGEVIGALGGIGFGHVEIGTITPRPQSGNPQPRLFRLPKAHGVINRMGFNNQGAEAVRDRIKGVRANTGLGINIGANRDSEDFVADFVKGVETFAPHADYLAVNVSSPNTPGLRDLQADQALTRLLTEVLAARSRAAVRVPVFLKLAPDLSETEMDAIAAVIARTDLDGLIVSNTTTDRFTVRGLEHAGEAGGLSGAPLFNLATQRLAQMRQRVGPDLPIIGVGGVHSAGTAIAKFAAGANAIQIYTALIFGGLDLVEEIKQGLVGETRRAGAATVAGLTGSDVEDWATGRAGI